MFPTDFACGKSEWKSVIFLERKLRSSLGFCPVQKGIEFSCLANNPSFPFTVLSQRSKVTEMLAISSHLPGRQSTLNFWDCGRFRRSTVSEFSITLQ